MIRTTLWNFLILVCTSGQMVPINFLGLRSRICVNLRSLLTPATLLGCERSAAYWKQVLLEKNYLQVSLCFLNQFMALTDIAMSYQTVSIKISIICYIALKISETFCIRLHFSCSPQMLKLIFCSHKVQCKFFQNALILAKLTSLECCYAVKPPFS